MFVQTWSLLAQHGVASKDSMEPLEHDRTSETRYACCSKLFDLASAV